MMNKSIFFFFLNFYSLLVFSSYSTPILLLPQLAKERNVNIFFIALIFMAFPVGAFPASIIIGKLMRFYKKSQLLIFFNAVASFSRFLIGILYFIDDHNLFIIVGISSRLLTGIAEGSIIPITYSFIPDLFPDPEEMMIKFGILEVWGSIGTMIGAPLASFLFEDFGYFSVFTIMSSINLFLGTLIIELFLKTDELVSFKKVEKDSLPIKDALFKNKAVLLTFFYLFVFFFPNFLIQPGYETYFSTLSSCLYVSSLVYSLILFGMIIGVVVIKYIYTKKNEKKLFFIFGFSVILALPFYGPDPFFGISDATTKIVFISIAFFIVGISIEVIFLITTKIMIGELIEVFPNETELCSDFANGMYTACFTLDQFLGPFIGTFLNDSVGYSKTGTYYALFSLGYFLLFWYVNRKKSSKYDIMADEGDHGMENNIKK